MHLHDVFMVERFQYLGLNKDVVYVTGRPDVLGFDDFYCKFLACLDVLCKEYVPKASLAQLVSHLVLSETTIRIEVLSFGCIKYGLILEILEVIFKILSPVRVEQSDLTDSKLLPDFIQGEPLMCGLHLVRFPVIAVGLVDEDLGRRWITIFYYIVFSTYSSGKNIILVLYFYNNLFKSLLRLQWFDFIYHLQGIRQVLG